jgi:hypothetical protein
MYRKVLGDENRWFVVELEQRDANDPTHYECMDDEADLLRREVQEHLTATVSTEI